MSPLLLSKVSAALLISGSKFLQSLHLNIQENITTRLWPKLSFKRYKNCLFPTYATLVVSLSLSSKMALNQKLALYRKITISYHGA